MTKDQLRTQLSQKEAEIRRLNQAEERVLKENEELEEEVEKLSSRNEVLEDELVSLHLRDKIAGEIVELLRDNSNDADLRGRRIYDLISDWDQVGMNLSR